MLFFRQPKFFERGKWKRLGRHHDRAQPVEERNARAFVIVERERGNAQYSRGEQQPSGTMPNGQRNAPAPHHSHEPRGTKEKPEGLENSRAPILPANNARVQAGVGDQRAGLRKIARGEYDLASRAFQFRNNRHKEWNVRRIFEIDPNQWTSTEYRVPSAEYRILLWRSRGNRTTRTAVLGTRYPVLGTRHGRQPAKDPRIRPANIRNAIGEKPVSLIIKISI